jgi:hypothetical protein
MTPTELSARVRRATQIAGVTLTAVLLLGTLAFVGIESTWVKPTHRVGKDAFRYGTTGTEIMPLAVFQVLPDLFPDQFQPAGPTAGDWVTQFGFIRGRPGVNEGLPQGFAVSNFRPKSGAPSPVPFVGVNCSLCHSSLLRRSEADSGVVVDGMGNASLDFLGWVEAFKMAVLDQHRMQADTIAAAFRRKFGRDLPLTERLFIGSWINQSRKTLLGNLPKIDAPYSGMQLRSPEYMPNGPSRTQPFRNLVRNVLDLPAATDRGFCKFPSLYEQRNREWGQFDGSVRDKLTRSVMAAIAVGATLDNLPMPAIGGSVQEAINYTLTLRGPRYADVFPGAHLEPARVERGRAVYMKSCSSCHGWRDPGNDTVWHKGVRQGDVVPLAEIGTDSERVSFRYRDVLADSLYAMFPARHPLKPKREELRPGPLGDTRGYLNMPLEAGWSRAPFLHNGSVPTLAELINLRPRRALYYRGANLFDSVDVGLVVPATGDALRYFRFDTSVRGNANRGHDYPWAYRGPGWDEHALEDLLAYLKTQ